jgi:hypothetical protein
MRKTVRNGCGLASLSSLENGKASIIWVQPIICHGRLDGDSTSTTRALFSNLHSTLLCSTLCYIVAFKMAQSLRELALKRSLQIENPSRNVETDKRQKIDSTTETKGLVSLLPF